VKINFWSFPQVFERIDLLREFPIIIIYYIPVLQGFYFNISPCLIISEPRRKNEDTEEAQKRRKQRAKKRKQQMQKKIEENKVNVKI